MLTTHFAEHELGVDGAEQRLSDNARYLCEQVLEPLRAHYDQPVNVHDGYRDPGHNARVGGKTASYHLFADGHAAADIDVNPVPVRTVFDWLRLESGLKFDKVILETNKVGIPACVHIQLDRLNPPRRKAYTGRTGAADKYIQVEAK